MNDQRRLAEGAQMEHIITPVYGMFTLKTVTAGSHNFGLDSNKMSDFLKFRIHPFHVTDTLNPTDARDPADEDEDSALETRTSQPHGM